MMEHTVDFTTITACGLCVEFPCEWLPQKGTWNPNIVEHLTELADLYHQKDNPPKYNNRN